MFGPMELRAIWVNGFLRDITHTGPFPFENSETMQYTGLKDKNGKEIYEGDILDWSALPDNERPIGWREREVVEFSDEAQWDADGSFVSWGYWLTVGNPTEAQVIGNIYENPELPK